jgi:hypothetical protein
MKFGFFILVNTIAFNTCVNFIIPVKWNRFNKGGCREIGVMQGDRGQVTCQEIGVKSLV